MNGDSKSIFASVTFWGMVLTFLAPIAGKYGYVIDDQGMANDIASMVGLLITFVGRLRANQPVHVIPPSN